MDKDKQQIIVLSILLVAIAGVIVFFNRHRFIPVPTVGTALPPPLPQIMLDNGQRDALFARDEFNDLEMYASPVYPANAGKTGNPEPFRDLTAVEVE